MQDGQGPTDAEDGASEPPRRSVLRLRDAEAVATVRRDMFGDGSLLDAPASSPPVPEPPPGSASDPAVSVQPAASSPEGDTAAGEGEARQEDPGEAASIEGAAPLADMAQSLDAIIDSFPAEPVAGTPQQAGADTLEAGGPGLPSGASPTPGSAGADMSGPAPDVGSAIATLQMGISSLFDSLGSLGQRNGDAAGPVEEPPPPGASTLDLDMSMLERSPVRPALPLGADPPASARPGGTPSLPLDPGPPANDAQVGHAPAGQTQADEAETETEAAQAGELDLDMSMLERPPARPVLQQETDADSPYGDLSLPPDRRLQEAETEERGLEDPAEPDGFAQYSLGDDGGSLPADLADPLHDTSGLPLSERPARPEFVEPSEPAYPPRFVEPTAPPSFRGLPEPQVLPAYTEPLDGEPRPTFDASDKIAAEAQATAQALDNLRGLLAHGGPGRQEPTELRGHDPAFDLGRAPGRTHGLYNLHREPSPFPSTGPAALMPMPVPPDRGSTRSIYVLGFLTGLGLSLMAGIALYVLINLI